MSWKYLFEPHIFMRGFYYYLQGAILEMKVHEDCIEAIVEGTEKYDVNISFSDGNIMKMRCTCPYARKGYECKHMVAVLCKQFESVFEDERAWEDFLCDLDERMDIEDDEKELIAKEREISGNGTVLEQIHIPCGKNIFNINKIIEEKKEKGRKQNEKNRIYTGQI